MKYIQNFDSNEGVIAAYHAPANALDDADVLLAWYGYGDYHGSSFVLFERDGKLFEVNGSHCSCYGLEGQWSEEETSWEALKLRDLPKYCEGSQEANAVLKRLVKKHLPKKAK